MILWTRSKTSHRAVLACLIAFLGSRPALAFKPHHKGGGMGPCGRELIHAPIDALKGRLKLTPEQIKQIEAVRASFAASKGKLVAQLEQERNSGMALWQTDLPDQGKVLAHMHKAHAIRGQLHEENLKTHLKLLSLLTKEQRAQLRAECSARGMKRGGSCGMGCGCSECVTDGKCSYGDKEDGSWDRGQCPHCGGGGGKRSMGAGVKGPGK